MLFASLSGCTQTVEERTATVEITGEPTFTSLTETAQLTATARDGAGEPLAGAVVSWSSSNSRVATVSESGLVTAVGNGTALLRAKVGLKSATVTATVNQRAVAVRLSSEAIELLALTWTQALTATVLDARDQPIAGAVVGWASSNEAVATVSETGLVTAKGNGDATLTASAGDLSASATVVVQQVPAAIRLSRPTHAFSSLGQTLLITAELQDAAGQPMASEPAVWSSASTSVATVSADGEVTATGPGTTSVTASLGGLTEAAFIWVGAPLRLVEKYLVHEFFNDERMPDYEYGGQWNEGGLVSWFAQGFTVADLWADGRPDVFVPLMKGYASGIDTRVKPIFLRNVNGVLENGSDQVDVPAIAGVRRFATLDQPNDPFRGLFTVQHDTHDGRMADALLVGAGATPLNQMDRVDPLPLAAGFGRDTAVNAHAMAGGDLDGDGRTDFVVADWGSWEQCQTCQPFFLMQREDGTWAVRQDDVLHAITFEQPLANPELVERHNLLVDVHLADFNGDGLADLVTGYGHGSAYDSLYLNQGDAKFTLESGIRLPPPPFGPDNSLHLRTWSPDLNEDGALDLVILFSRHEPYYGGYAFQFLINDGAGNFRDETAARLHSFSENESPNERLMWSDNFQFLDVNGDDQLDLIGAHGGGADPTRGRVRLWLGGDGRFNEVPVDTGGALRFTPLGWADFGGSGRMGTVGFQVSWADAEGTAHRLSFTYYELDRAVPIP